MATYSRALRSAYNGYSIVLLARNSNFTDVAATFHLSRGRVFGVGVYIKTSALNHKEALGNELTHLFAEEGATPVDSFKHQSVYVCPSYIGGEEIIHSANVMLGRFTIDDLKKTYAFTRSMNAALNRREPARYSRPDFNDRLYTRNWSAMEVGHR